MNARKTILATLFAAAFVAPLAAVPVQAQNHAQALATRAYTQAELDQMLAPIALYPDALLSQVLMAATYPIEVVEAARWTRANPGLQGDAAVRAVENQDWDPSVKSLVAFPQILQRMDEQLSWTESLGDAFLDQESQLMDTVQQLRGRAQAAGNLQSSEQIYVRQQGPTILIEPASPQYVYVPYYDPQVVYGTWWWPAYRPVYWAPWPGYARPHRPGYTAGFWWGRPVGLSVNFFFGNVDWRQRHVHVAHPRAYYYRPPVYVNRTVVADRGRWQHDPHHRRGVDYRANEVRQRFAASQFERRDGRNEQRQDQRRDQREAQRPDPRRDQREVRSPWQRQDAQPQGRPEQTRSERREAREEQQGPRSDAQSAERAQQRQREQAQAAERAQRQQREQNQAAERAQRDRRDHQAEAARAQQQQQRQQGEAARAQQRQQAEAARAQQQQQRQEQRSTMPAAQTQQTPRAERQEQRQERREQRQERDQKG